MAAINEEDIDAAFLNKALYRAAEWGLLTDLNYIKKVASDLSITLDYYSGMPDSANSTTTTVYDIKYLVQSIPQNINHYNVMIWFIQNCPDPSKYLDIAVSDPEDYPFPADLLNFVKTPSLITMPVITGTKAVRQVLTVSNGTWKCALPLTYTYQWYVNNQPVASGGTASTFTPVDSSIGALISCDVKATSSYKATTQRTSDFGPLAGITPTATGLSISGNTAVGSIITMADLTLNGVPTPTVQIDWFSGTEIVSSNSQTYVLKTSDIGKSIQVKIVVKNSVSQIGYSSNTIGPVVAAAAPANTVLPAITGTATVGQTLTASNGTWTGAPTPTFTRQWLRDGVNISGATASTYVLVVADIGTKISVKVTGTNASGSVNATSVETATVAGSAPVNTVAPAITGTPTVGQTLTVSNGTWTGVPTPTYTYQWKGNGTNISGATASTYVLVVGDATTNITCSVTGTNLVGNATATSAAVGPVAAA